MICTQPVWNLISTDKLISHVYLCMDIPNDALHCILLQLCAQLVSECVAKEEGLQQFSMFAKPVLAIFSASDSVDVSTEIIM